MKPSTSQLTRSSLTLAATVALGGCATIFGYAGPETLNIRSSPDQAAIVVADETGTTIFQGTTPTMVSLEKKRAYFGGKRYAVTISKPGYRDQQITVDTRVNGWYVAGNLLFGGLIGYLIVDPLTGAMWTLDTNEINPTLQPVATDAPTSAVRRGYLVLLQDVPPQLRERMLPIPR